MAPKDSAPQVVTEKLHEAIDGLRKDVTRVEIWATALSEFAKPVPDYRPNLKYELGRPGEAAERPEIEAGTTPPTGRQKSSE